MRDDVRCTLKSTVLALLLAALGCPAFAQTIEAPFTADLWELEGASLAEHLGRQALRGTASLKGVEFENGVIEFDLAVSGEGTYPGIAFRVEGDDWFERVYIRPHRAGRYPDALQYTPTMNGMYRSRDGTYFSIYYKFKPITREYVSTFFMARSAP
jgi:hypothetical protein